MDDNELKINVAARPPTAAIKVAGDLTQMGLYRLKSEFAKLERENLRFVVLNLRKVASFDNAALGGLFQVISHSREAGGQIVVVRPRGGRALTSLEQSNIRDIAPFFDEPMVAYRTLCQGAGLAHLLDEEQDQPTAKGSGHTLKETLSNLLKRVEAIERRLNRVEDAINDDAAAQARTRRLEP